MSATSFRDLSPAEFLAMAKMTVAKAKKSAPKSRVAFEGMRIWIDKRVQSQSLKPAKESALGQLEYAFNSIDDADAVDDDDMLSVMDTLDNFFDVITDMDLEDEDYEINTNMSASLLRILGRSDPNPSRSQSNPGSQTWTAPARSGLENSNRIIPRKAESKNASEFDSDAKGVRSPSDKQVPPAKALPDISLDERNSRPAAGDKYGGDYDNDDSSTFYTESVLGGDDDKFTETKMSSVGFSLIYIYYLLIQVFKLKLLVLNQNLMEALGMDMTMVDREETDWRPPARSGLEYSQPIVRRIQSDSKAADEKSTISLDDEDDSSTMYTESQYGDERPISNIAMSSVSRRKIADMPPVYFLPLKLSLNHTYFFATTVESNGGFGHGYDNGRDRGNGLATTR